MFETIKTKQTDITTKDLDLNLNVDDDFNFESYINSQNVDDDI